MVGLGEPAHVWVSQIVVRGSSKLSERVQCACDLSEDYMAAVV